MKITSKPGGFKWNPTFRLDIRYGNDHQMKVSLAEIRRSVTVTCPTCGKRVHLEAQQFNRTLAEVECKLRNLGR